MAVRSLFDKLTSDAELKIVFIKCRKPQIGRAVFTWRFFLRSHCNPQTSATGIKAPFSYFFAPKQLGSLFSLDCFSMFTTEHPNDKQQQTSKHKTLFVSLAGPSTSSRPVVSPSE